MIHFWVRILLPIWVHFREWASEYIVLRYLHIRLDYFFFYSTISIIAWYSTLKILISSTIYSHIRLALDHFWAYSTRPFDTGSDSYSTNLVLSHSLLLGFNHVHLTLRNGIVSHGLMEEKLFSHSMGMIIGVFVNELFGRKNLGVGNHSRDLWEHNQNSLGTNPM